MAQRFRPPLKGSLTTMTSGAIHNLVVCWSSRQLKEGGLARHDLVTPKEQAAVLAGVEVGVMVEFEAAGERLVGKVNRVTKNATVLVPCAAQHQESRKFSDGRYYRKFFVPIRGCKVVS